MTADHDAQRYLKPYLDAAKTYGAGFGSLLWASPTTQAARFDAILKMADLNGKSVLDVGCGRADLLDHMLKRGVRPADYVGIEAVSVLAEAAAGKRLPRAIILKADFVTDPVKMFVGADVVVFSGSLNTVEDAVFYATLTRAFDAATEALVFNFLSSPMLAGQDFLHWRFTDDVLAFARRLSPRVTQLATYLPGDTTVCVQRDAEHGAK